MSDYQVTLKARQEVMSKAYIYGSTNFEVGDVNIEFYEKIGYAIVQVGKIYKIENIKDKTLLDMIAIAIEMKKATKKE